MSHTSLRIKKIYFDAIASGTKRYEYRAYTSFYRRILEKPLSSITFHYQQLERLTCMIKSIRVIRKPMHLVDDEAFPGDHVFQIEVQHSKRWKIS